MLWRSSNMHFLYLLADILFIKMFFTFDTISLLIKVNSHKKISIRLCSITL